MMEPGKEYAVIDVTEIFEITGRIQDPVGAGEREERMTIGEKLAAARRNLGLTQDKLAEKMDVTFQTVPQWIDSMTITYTVILLNPKPDAKKNEKPMTLMQTTVEYADVAQDREHKAGAVVLPAALLRLGEPLGFAVSISVGGKEVASQGVGKGPLQSHKEWWKDSAILDHPNVQRRDAYMMDRMKSPFQLVDPDDYEMSR